MTQLEQYIKSYFGISEAHLSVISEMFKEEQVAKNDFYIKKDQFCNKLSFITEGNLRIYDLAENGKEITQWISTPGDFITDLSGLIFRTKTRRDIKALSNAKLFTIYREDYENIGLYVPNWDKLEKMFIAKCFITLEDRIFSFLSMDSKERYDHLFDYNPSLFNEVPLQHLASMLGMSPETLSRIRSNS